MKIVILSSSVRIGRNSHRLALYFNNYITENKLADAEIADLYEYQFPVFNERLQYMPNPPANVLEFSQKINDADGVLIVTPEYNGGYPAALKNVIDLLYPEWRRKPVAIAAASDGQFGGTQVVTSLVFSLFKIGVLLVPARFHASSVQNNYDENGIPKDKEAADKRTKRFIDELLWCMEAKKRMDTQ
jgi:NAD(P)H-dependent FMN reductase